MLLPDGSIDFKSAIFTNNQIYPEGLYSPRGYQLYLLCASLGISKQSSDDELIGGIYWHIHRNPSTMAGNSTVDLLSSSNTANDSTNNSTTKQSMEVVLKRLQECDRQQLESICNSFGIPTLRKHDTLIIMIQDHLRRNPFLLSKNGTIPPQLLLNYDVSQSNPLTVSRDQLRSFSDICGIPYDFTKAEYAVNIKKKLLDSASPLVGEGGMVNLQFTSRPLRKDIIDKYNKPVHIDSLEVLSSSQLLKFCKMIGNEHPLVKKKRRRKSRLRPLYLDSLDSLDRNDIWMMCGSYGVSTKIPKELLLERFRLYLSEHPEVVRADGTIDLGLSQI
ncbi:hypothetical protein BASA62_005635 [Batrachochytrium salamandrivorans]|nr:hypothetical protein BASA62_005635 [Batrachochytrium salamandrivorans]